MSAPEPVRARFWVPSASMVMMRVWPARPSGELAKTMWRPSGDQEGKSQRPLSWVSWIQRLVATLHDVDVLAAGSAGAVLAVPGEGEELAVGRPGGRGGVAAVGHALHAGAVGVHDVELRQAGAAADPGDLRAGLGVPGGRDVRAREAGDAAGDAAVRRRRSRSRGRRCARRRRRAGCRWAPRRARVGAAGRGEVDHAAEQQRDTS